MKKLDNKLHMGGLGTDLIYQGRGGWSETIGHGAPYGGVGIRLNIPRARWFRLE